MRIRSGLLLCVMFLGINGCKTSTLFIKPADQHTIDRSVVDYPPSCDFKPIAENLNCPTSICFDPDGTLFIVEGGIDNQPLHIFGRRADESLVEIYPAKTRVPFVRASKFKIYGPVGGIAASNGKVFVSHRDVNDMGVITAFNYDGTHSTVVSEFPAQGDYGITDIAIRPGDGRLFFGVGPATNSGVVGPDNLSWVAKHPNACDMSPVDLKLYGLKFTSEGGSAGRAVTAPFQPYNSNDKTRIKKAPNSRANSCVYSVSQSGGDVTQVAMGIRLPRGIGFSDFGCFATNDGMEMRGTRPIKDDPDALVKIVPDSSFCFPDFTSDMNSVSEDKYQPPASLMKDTGYPEINPLVDRDNSNPPGKIIPPSRALLKGIFPSMSGASKFDFIPDNTTVPPYRNFGGQAIVALSGDRAPFSTSGQPLTNGPVGYKIVAVKMDDSRKVTDFIYNVRGLPASKIGKNSSALERPCDVKMGPDGSIYVLDMGQFTMKGGKIRVVRGTGRIFKLTPNVEPERPTAPK